MIGRAHLTVDALRRQIFVLTMSPFVLSRC
jgi:hypothetical protein